MTDLTATTTRLRAIQVAIEHSPFWAEERELYPHLASDLLALLDALEGKTEENKRALKLMGEAWGSLNFILAFYEPRQTYLDTNAWKQAEASARRSHAALRAWLDEPAHAVILQHEDNQP